MTISDLYKISKNINDIIGEINTNISIDLESAKYENLQQEVYKAHNKTLVGYEQKKNFDVIIMNVKFLFKRKD